MGIAPIQGEVVTNSHRICNPAAVLHLRCLSNQAQTLVEMIVNATDERVFCSCLPCDPADQLQAPLEPFGPECPRECYQKRGCPRECPTGCPQAGHSGNTLGTLLDTLEPGAKGRGTLP